MTTVSVPIIGPLFPPWTSSPTIARSSPPRDQLALIATPLSRCDRARCQLARALAVLQHGRSDGVARVASLERGEGRPREQSVTVQLWKSGGSADARVTFSCPWCEVTGTASVAGCHAAVRDFWLLAGCPAPECGRALLLRVPRRGPWLDLDGGAGGLLLDRSCVLPAHLPTFAAIGVPRTIAVELEEAHQCRAGGQFLAAALVARHLLATLARARGIRDRKLERAVRALVSNASQPLRDHLPHLRLLAGDTLVAAPAAGDIDRLLVFVEELLHALFSTAARLGSRADSQ